MTNLKTMSLMINRRRIDHSFRSLFEGDTKNDTFVPVKYDESEKQMTYRIPAHQRFYNWNPEQERACIDSVINNYPVNSVCVIVRIDATTCPARPVIYYDVEDGQSRLTCCWKFANEKFTIMHEGNETTFSDLPQNIRNMISDYLIPFEEITFTQELTHQGEQEIISNIFIRINCGKHLTSNDKYYACSHVPVMRIIHGLKVQFSKTMKTYCLNVGGGKTRMLLDHFAAVILAIGHGNIALLIASFDANYKFMNDPISHESITRIGTFFVMYFGMLKTHNVTEKLGKLITKLSNFLGYCAYLFITDLETNFNTNHAMIWYLDCLKQNTKFVPTTFSILTSAHQRNCGPVPISCRVKAISEAYDRTTESDE